MSLQYFRELFHYLGFSYKKRGLYLTLKLFYLKFDNRFFDLRYGIDSSQNVSLDKLNFQITNKTEGMEYGTIAPYFIQKILELVKFDTSDIFVDLGCGKGRVLLIASKFNFKKIIGIEFSPELYLIAQKNIGNCLSNNHFNTEKINLIQKDVLDYVFNHHETVFYLYNSFSIKILKRFCDQIKGSLIINPRRIIIIYVNPSPTFPEILIEKGFKQIMEYDLINKKCFVYSNQVQN